jgi:hypothetical protein
MQLKELPDWSSVRVSLASSAMLKSAKSSQLGHFVILDFESQGVPDVKLLEVGADRIDRILAVLNENIGRSVDELNNLEIGD